MAVKLLLINNGRKMILNIYAIATILPEEILKSYYICLVLFIYKMQYFKINTSSTSILNPPLYYKSLFILKELCLLYIYIAYLKIFATGE